MVSMRILPPQDAMFLWGETPDTKFHVASLTILTPPPDGGRHYLRDLEDELRTAPVESPWNLKLSHPKLLRHPLQSWVVDEQLDLDYHVRRSALASPGDERELGVLVSRLHSHQIDFSRPPWEMHVIEGLEGGRFAIYIKVHHALVDGYSGVQMFSRSMSPDQADRSIPFFFSLRQRRRPAAHPEARGLAQQVAGSVSAASSVVTGIASVGAKAAKAVAKLEFGSSDDLTNPHQAPDTILNAPTGRNRRFATQQFEIERLRRIARASGGTLNDVVLAVCGGGLRTFLLEQKALPDKPLIAFVPVNLREHGDDGGAGNKVGLMLASMATDIADPRRQLRAVMRSTSSAKGQMRGFDQWAALAYSGYLLAPGAGQVLAAMAGLKHNPFPTAFNVVISNLAGPRETRYLRGSRVEAYYPVSIPVHGVALNITLLSYADTINFGFVGCRDAVPSLQKLAVYTGQALDRLEAAYAEAPAAKAAAKKTPPAKAAAKKTPPAKAAAKKTAAVKPAAKKTPAATKATAKSPAKAAAKKAATKAPAAKKATRAAAPRKRG